MSGKARARRHGAGKGDHAPEHAVRSHEPSVMCSLHPNRATGYRTTPHDRGPYVLVFRHQTVAITERLSGAPLATQARTTESAPPEPMNPAGPARLSPC